MKKNRFRIFLIIGFLVLSGYFLYPTWIDYSNQQALAGLKGKDSLDYVTNNEESIRANKAKRLKLGLDLQGGMYVTMEVDVEGLLEKMAKNKDEVLRGILEETRKESATSEDPVISIFAKKFEARAQRMSRYYGDIRDDNATIVSMLESETNKAVDRALRIIQNRIDQYGVAETAIQRQGARRIVLELPGVSDEKEVRSLIQATAQLEFKVLQDPKRVLQVWESLDKVLLGKFLDDSSAVKADSLTKDSTALAKTQTEKAKQDSLKAKQDSIDAAKLTEEQKVDKYKKEHPFTTLLAYDQQTGRIFADEDQRLKVIAVLKREDVLRVIPPDFQFAWSVEEKRQSEGKAFYELFLLKRDPELTGEVITNARAQTDQQGFGGAVVTMQMSSEGAREWARITGANVNKQIAIVLDDVVYSAPNVKQKIIGGNSEISGMKNLDEARLLEIVLKAGALPAPVEIIEERTIGPSLGEDSIQQGFYSFAIGVVLVILFMMVYYQTAGFVADFAVLFNVLFILGILAGFNATLTLPGIAGMLLTVGMAVDANVLINERVREELGTGKTLRAAIDSGYARAFSAILDSNVTTLITCIILYQFGSGPVQGFALTLMIGLICSMFTAIVMTRVFFEVTLDYKQGLVRFG